MQGYYIIDVENENFTFLTERKFIENYTPVNKRNNPIYYINEDTKQIISTDKEPREYKSVLTARKLIIGWIIRDSPHLLIARTREDILHKMLQRLDYLIEKKNFKKTQILLCIMIEFIERYYQ